MVDSDSKELLVIEPNELRFPFETKKQISCSLQLRNRTNKSIAFKFKVNILAKYGILPNSGIVRPQSNCDVIVTMQAQKEAPLNMECKDKILVHSVVVWEGATRDDITNELFKNDSGNLVEQVMLKVVYVQPPRLPWPVPEGSEEGSLPHPSWSDGGNQDDLGAHKEPEVFTSDVSPSQQEASSLTEPAPSSSTFVSKLEWRMGGSNLQELLLLGIEPNELRFSFEVMKILSCSLQLRNITDECMAFKVKVTNPKVYCVRPNVSIVPPRSTCNVIVTKQAVREAPPNMLCKDKFLVQSVVVMEGTIIKDITLETFEKESGNVVKEVKMCVVYVQPPGQPSDVLEGSEEGSSPLPSWSDGGDISYQDDFGVHKEPKEITSETGSTLHHMTLQQLKDITNNFSNEGILGKGGFGVVYKGVLENRETIAVKRLVHSMPSSQQQFENEVNLLMKLKHPNIVQLVGYCYETQHLHNIYEGKSIFAWSTECLLCLEYLPKGSLDKYISEASSGLDWPTRYTIIEQISHGLRYLHEEDSGPIMHLDLKPANILLDENMIPKITDFGLSRLYDQNHTIHTAMTSGTLGYMSPEYLRGIITPMSDIFSLGVIIMEVITGHRDYPYDVRTSSTVFIEFELQKWRNVLPKEPCYLLEAHCLQIKRCIQIGLICVNLERTKRPTMKNVIDMLQGLESMNWYVDNELSSHDNKAEL